MKEQVVVVTKGERLGISILVGVIVFFIVRFIIGATGCYSYLYQLILWVMYPGNSGDNLMAMINVIDVGGVILPCLLLLISVAIGYCVYRTDYVFVLIRKAAAYDVSKDY